MSNEWQQGWQAGYTQATTTEAMTYMGIGRTKLWELVKHGHLHPSRIGRRLMYNTTDIQTFMGQAT